MTALVKADFRISPIDRERLKQAAIEIGKPASVLTREIVCRWLDQWQIESQRQKPKKL